MSRLLPVLFVAAAAALAFVGSTAGPNAEPAKKHSEATATAFTTRLPAGDPEAQAIVVSQTVYSATREDNAAGAVILCPQNEALAFTAMNRVTHMPVNAPLLYLNRQGTLSQETREELKRVRPDGVDQDGDTQVYIIGTPDRELLHVVANEMKHVTRVFAEDDPVRLAELLDRWQAAFKSDHPDEIVLACLDHPDGIAHAMGAMGWNAHMGKGFGWVYRDAIPDETKRILSRPYPRGGQGAYIYLMGPSEVISDKVAREAARYGVVRRIQGDDIYATNAVNAGYKDFGRNYGWYWGWKGRDFGWGIAQAGHNYIIANGDDLLGAIPAVLLGHMGKHGPMLLVRRDEVPQRVADYLRMVQPFQTSANETIRNHAWIIGNDTRLTWNLQKQVHGLLAPTGVQLLTYRNGQGGEGRRMAQSPTSVSTPEDENGSGR